MVLLRVLTGSQAGAVTQARCFPFRVGRASSADWRIEAPGVWDEQFEILLSQADGFLLAANAATLTCVNGERVSQAPLRNGDHIECGDLRIQFWLSPAHQRGLRARETATWVALAGLAAVQAYLFWWLTQ